LGAVSGFGINHNSNHCARASTLTYTWNFQRLFKLLLKSCSK